MQTLLFIDSDTCLTFKNRAAAFIYAEKQGLTSWMLLTKYDGEMKGRCSVFNPFITEVAGCVEYFDSEADALKYIGSFI